jgi:ABC-type uncharacterized transport system ATPase subunit
LGEEKGFVLNPSFIEKSVAAASEHFGIQVKPDCLVSHLSVGERQRVEILKALYRIARVLILDEPNRRAGAARSGCFVRYRWSGCVKKVYRSSLSATN